MDETPFSVEECSVGTGALCGSVYLDQAFKNLLKKKFGEQAETFLTKRRLAELVRHFDSSIKREYNPYDPACDEEFEIFIGIPDIPEIELWDDYLRLSRFTCPSKFL